MLDRLTMKPEHLDSGSALSAETRFRFAQQDTRSCRQSMRAGRSTAATSSGCSMGNTLDFRYVQLSPDGRVDAGQSRCEVIANSDGIRLIERYTWETRDGTGTNVFVQCAGDARRP